MLRVLWIRPGSSLVPAGQIWPRQKTEPQCHLSVRLLSACCVFVCLGQFLNCKHVEQRRTRSLRRRAHLAAFLSRTALVGRGGRSSSLGPPSSPRLQTRTLSDAADPSDSAHLSLLTRPGLSGKIAWCGCIGEKARLDMMSDKDARGPGRLRARTGGHTSSSDTGRELRFSTVLLVSEREAFYLVLLTMPKSPRRCIICSAETLEPSQRRRRGRRVQKPRPALSKAAFCPRTWRGNSLTRCCCWGNLVVHGGLEVK